MKKFFFYNLSVFLFFSTVLLFDFILSNTILKYQHCYNYSEYYYDLKKNCSGKYRFKSSFPLVKTITDEMGLRTGSQKVEKKKTRKIFLFSGILLLMGLELNTKRHTQVYLLQI